MTEDNKAAAIPAATDPGEQIQLEADSSDGSEEAIMKLLESLTEDVVEYYG